MMGEGAAVAGSKDGSRFGALQRAHLEALGLVPMVRRDAVRPGAPVPAPRAGSETPARAAARGAVDPPAERTIRLCVAGSGAWPAPGPDARLLDDLLASLGLSAAQVQWVSGGAPPEGIPMLAFGVDAARGALRLPALARLRDALEKRIAWPQLRRLRRQLREAVR